MIVDVREGGFWRGLAGCVDPPFIRKPSSFTSSSCQQSSNCHIFVMRMSAQARPIQGQLDAYNITQWRANFFRCSVM